MFTQIVFLFILILFNAFFAASEIAVLSLNNNKIRIMAENGDKKAILINNFIKDPEKFLATIQIGITLANLLSSAFAADTFADKLAIAVERTGLPIPSAVLKPMAVIVITIILSYFTLVIGELVPKKFALQKPEKISRFAVGPLTVLSFIAFPFVKFLSFSTNTFIKILGGDPNAAEDNITEEEIRMMVDEGEESGAIQEDEREVINNIFDFDDKFVSDVMTHRMDVLAVPIDSELDKIVDLITEEGFSRIPVYEESIDDIVGVLHAKDLMKLVKEDIHKDFDVKDIMREPYFVPEFKNVSALFKELRQNKVHMAIVIDEYGGTSGIVTMEDLLEEIVGSILDEYDEEEKVEYEKLDENTYMFDGTISLDKVEDIMNIKLPTEKYETLSGYIIGQIGKIPSFEDKTAIELDNIVFKVEEVEERRISKIKSCRI
ncbi:MULTISPECIES: hemolysin family protein [Tissierellales]|uniref:HlyC/CorC family transporter n=1 Tax=Acidilutibacter cellobiosedens TaxID=2507161 RepID=A0A410QBC9_9FIRM|nr:MULTISPECIES: hemolysin family protein [Tissierellales]MBE6082513.1 HlyC/CorC family transporter [Tissierellaceae bacterium]QAT61184.1 HlyC/CorC family transporter [Acidilutibacter cellobiosedens]SCL93706.1 Magnesium and cobalt efflux protein CorC [Sporanaerobacter sp. PP17-6a]